MTPGFDHGPASDAILPVPINKTATHIEGLDEILHGGLPSGRVSLICGGPGTGKTVLCMELICRSALSGDAALFFSFEEPVDSLRQNARSFGWDLDGLEKSGKVALVEGKIDIKAVTS